MFTDDKKDGRQVSGQKSSEGGRGNPEKASPAAVERYMKGIDLPAQKKDLIERAKQNNAPEDVMSVLNRFEEKTYNTAVDIAKEVGRIE